MPPYHFLVISDAVMNLPLCCHYSAVNREMKSPYGQILGGYNEDGILMKVDIVMETVRRVLEISLRSSTLEFMCIYYYRR